METRQKEGHTPTPNWPTFARFASRYLNDVRPVVAAGQTFTAARSAHRARGDDSGHGFRGRPVSGNWQVTGGTGAYKFELDRETGAITIHDRLALDVSVTSYDLTVMASDGKRPSKPAYRDHPGATRRRSSGLPEPECLEDGTLAPESRDGARPSVRSRHRQPRSGPTRPRVVSVTSNEAINGPGDGNTAPDWAITGDMTVEPAGRALGQGRRPRLHDHRRERRPLRQRGPPYRVTVTVAHNQ
jgi:hypothetical protein